MSRLMALLTAASMSTACREAQSPVPAATVEQADVPSAVASCQAVREPLRLDDGTHVYVEPENLITVGSRALVAGVPTYTWTVGPASKVIMKTRDAHVAALFGDDGVALVERPVDVPLGDVRAVDLGDGSWAALLSEVGRDPLRTGGLRGNVWYGEHDGRRWDTVEPLPAPPAGRLDFSSSSELTTLGGRLAWAVAARRPDGSSSLRLYERLRGRWRSREVFDVWAEETALAYDSIGRLWLAVVSEDPELRGWQRSLRLYARTAGWQLASRVWVVQGGTQIREPTVTILPDGVAVTWRSVGRGGAIGLARVGISLHDEGSRVRIDLGAQQIVPLSTPEGAPSWLVHRINPVTQLSELRLVRAVADAGSVVRSDPNPYLGFFAAQATTHDEVLVVGPEFDPDPTRPTVRSLILRLSTSCT